MPGFDGTGLLGQGLMTGRRKGYGVLKISEGDPLARAFEQSVLACGGPETDTFGEIERR